MHLFILISFTYFYTEVIFFHTINIKQKYLITKIIFINCNDGCSKNQLHKTPDWELDRMQI